MVGQALYRLVIVDFLFLILGSFFGEFLSKWVGRFQFMELILFSSLGNMWREVSLICGVISLALSFLCCSVIGTRLILSLGVPEFDVARNVLELIYAQTLAWWEVQYFTNFMICDHIYHWFIFCNSSQSCRQRQLCRGNFHNLPNDTRWQQS